MTTTTHRTCAICTLTDEAVAPRLHTYFGNSWLRDLCEHCFEEERAEALQAGQERPWVQNAPTCSQCDEPCAGAILREITVDGVIRFIELCDACFADLDDESDPQPTCIVCGDVNVTTDDPALCVDCHRARFPDALDRAANAGARRLGAMAAALLLAFSLSPTSAAETLTYTSPGGHTLTLPYVGTPAYSDSCTITMAWEDHSALAYCSEDGATYVYHPYQPNTKPDGWYPQ